MTARARWAAGILLALAAALSIGAGPGGELAIEVAPAPEAGWAIDVRAPDSDDGRRLAIRWTEPREGGAGAVLLLRRASDSTTSDLRIPTGIPLPPTTRLGAWTVVASADGAPAASIIDEVDPDGRYIYALLPAVRASAPDTYASFAGRAYASAPAAPEAALFNRKRWLHLALIALIAGSLAGFTYLAKRRTLFVRRLPGVDAIEDAVGRSTEMGRPILYVTGSTKTEDIQTIASILILGHVAEIAATYETELRVANAYPLTMVIAEEVVRQGYANAGRADAHRPEDVMFITSEQFAFAAAVNGIILRERPAANIYFGRFLAESLMLAETGFLTGAVQIAGTAELTQLPFFVSACDFTLIGEELFACSAYLSREPNQLATLKAGDALKLVIAVAVIVGAALATARSLGAEVPFTLEELIP